MLREIDTNIYVGNIASFGDAKELDAAGVALAMCCVPNKAFPHTPSIAAIAMNLPGDDNHPDFTAELMAQTVEAFVARGLKVALCDGSGGESEAAGVLAGYYARVDATSYVTALDKAKTKLSNLNLVVPAPLKERGERVWPDA